MDRDGPHVLIVAGAGAGISTEPGDGGAASEGGGIREPKKEKRNLKTRDFGSGQRERGATQKLEALNMGAARGLEV
jgi:hypothetical protein